MTVRPRLNTFTNCVTSLNPIRRLSTKPRSKNATTKSTQKESTGPAHPHPQEHRHGDHVRVHLSVAAPAIPPPPVSCSVKDAHAPWRRSGSGFCSPSASNRGAGRVRRLPAVPAAYPPRNAPPDLPEVAPAAGADPPTASPGLAKLNMRYTAASGRVGLRFQPLHQHQHHHTTTPASTSGTGPPRAQVAAEQGAFQWGRAPRLVTEAAENGWAQFVFLRRAAAADKSNSSSPLWHLPDLRRRDEPRHGRRGRVGLPTGSSERMQAVRLNPSSAAARRASSTKKRLPSPLRGDTDAGNNNPNPNALCIARMSLPLPGPPLAGAPFRAGGILGDHDHLPEHETSRVVSFEGEQAWKDGSTSESDRVKLISFAPDAAKDRSSKRTEPQSRREQRHLVMSLGSPSRPPLRRGRRSPGRTASSIGFHSNGAVYLDGTDEAGVRNRRSPRGPACGQGGGVRASSRRAEVFFTVDGQLVPTPVSCNAEASPSPLYRCLASSFDVMALGHPLGQGKFRYAPANARRTANPCFVRARVRMVGRPRRRMGAARWAPGLRRQRRALLHGRVDSGWMETLRMAKSRKRGVAGSGAASVGRPGRGSPTVEISLRD
ncbi:hypothetical protein HU200_004320 [Digitaria exilis]|uniref:Uncharacterized protein n=1 Tax=Digitaria exilis TaxID=1010633 RepID=A0A835KTL6_9POAL|nr:hypothetical protein HU200_004320 [Digitaria exilis]